MEAAMKQKRAALYVRVSTGEQNTEAQERVLREYVKRRKSTKFTETSAYPERVQIQSHETN
jgi:DNA invertase Pin-like site-specific DNA recombinase